MNKKIVATVIVLLLAGIGWLAWSLLKEKQANRDMQELAALDKQEMEKEYQNFAAQYSEMKTYIKNDSIIEQLTAEQARTQKLLDELKKTHTNDVAEITRLKKELATVRAVIRSYVLQIDSLNRLNESLVAENDRVRSELEQSNQQNQALTTEKASLSEKVAIAAQLDATNITLTPLSKKGKTEKYMKNARSLAVSFTVTKNVTAQNGMRTVYVRITSPTGSLLGNAGSFNYENRTLQCSMKKAVEYGGQETPVTLYWNVDQSMVGGNYQVSIFADGHMIGSRSFSFN